MRRLLLAGALVGLAAPLAAQSSTFGIRGLGFPNPGYSAHSRALGGSLGLFDPESSLNPATLGTLGTLTANVTTMPEWQTVESPAGNGSVRSMRFPLIGLAGPIPGSKFSIGLTAGSYTVRDFSQAFTDTLPIRGTQEPVFDTVTGRGGVSDLRLALGWQASEGLRLGGSLHALTGTDRVSLVRHFADTLSYATASQASELSYGGFGADLGAIARLGARLDLALAVRSDGNVKVERDSIAGGYSIDLPYMFGAGLRYRPSANVTFTSQGIYRTWSGANSDLLAQGGTGSRNVWDLSAGVEIVRDLSRPFDKPIRFGARYTELPFPFAIGDKPKEWALAAGTGKLFARGMGGFDASLEHVWRSEEGGFKESAWLLTIGVTVRPYYQPTPGSN